MCGLQKLHSKNLNLGLKLYMLPIYVFKLDNVCVKTCFKLIGEIYELIKLMSS
jgi:hypothetical protein